MEDQSDCDSVCTDITSIDDEETPGEQFLKACRIGTGYGIRELLKFTIPNFKTTCNKNGQSGMCLACSTGNLAAVKELIQSNVVDVNMSDNEGNTPLMMAVRAGYDEIVRYFLFQTRGKVLLDVENQGGFTALMQAALHGRTNCARMIVIAGADVTKCDWGRGLRADEWALMCGMKETAVAIKSVARCLLTEEQVVELNWKKRSNPLFSFVHNLRQQITRAFGWNGDDWIKEAGALYHLTAQASALSSSILTNSSESIPKSPKPHQTITQKNQQNMVCIDHHPNEASTDGVLVVEMEYNATNKKQSQPIRPTVTQNCFQRNNFSTLIKDRKKLNKLCPVRVPDVQVTHASPIKQNTRRVKNPSDRKYLTVPSRRNKNKRN